MSTSRMLLLFGLSLGVTTILDSLAFRIFLLLTLVPHKLGRQTAEVQYCAKVLGHPSFLDILQAKQEIDAIFFKLSSGIVLQASWGTFQSFSLDVGCLLFFSLSATDFQSTSCVIWHTSAFSPCSPSLRMASWQPPFFHGDHFWWGFIEQSMNQLRVQMHLSGLVSGFCWISPSFLRTSLSDTVRLLQIV